MWANNRFWMETQNLVTKRYGGKRKQHWYALLMAMKTFEWGLKRLGQYQRGWNNAANIVLREIELRFPSLPRGFDGFSILHISDPHLDGMPGIEDRIVELCRGREFDLCVLTGDYRTELHGPIRAVMASLQRLVQGIRAVEGFLGVLGNHDDCHMVAPMEAMGIRMLINESVVMNRGGDRLRILGTDDVHYYYTDQSLHALEAAREDFSIALVHSPELYDAAAEAGVALYLCGHTHGGQVCLPLWGALVTNCDLEPARAKGLHRHPADSRPGDPGSAWLHVSAGLGTSPYTPFRIACRPEATLLTLTPRA
jgi:predicted MPP superfamily phosphohydrolase